MVERLKPYRWFILWALCNHLLFYFLNRVGSGRKLFGDEQYYITQAQNIFSHFDPHPFWPPGQFVFLGIIQRISDSALFFYVIQLLALAFAATILASMLIRLGFERTRCIQLGLIFFGWPELAGMTHLYWPEISHLLWFLLAINFSIQSSKSWLGGLFWGIAITFKLVFSVFTPVLLVLLWLYHKNLKTIILWMVPLALVCLPTLIWNYNRLESFTLGSSGPFNVWVGVTDPDSPDAVNAQAGARKAEFDTWQGSLKEKNQVAISRAFDHLKSQGVSVVWKQPLKNFSRLLSAETTLVTFIPPGPRNRFDIQKSAISHGFRWYLRLHHVLLFLGLVWAIRIWPREKKWVFHYMGLLAFALYGLAFVFLHCKTRFLIPFLPWMLVIANTKREGSILIMGWKRATAMMVILGLTLRFSF